MGHEISFMSNQSNDPNNFDERSYGRFPYLTIVGGDKNETYAAKCSQVIRLQVRWETS